MNKEQALQDLLKKLNAGKDCLIVYEDNKGNKKIIADTRQEETENEKA